MCQCGGLFPACCRCFLLGGRRDEKALRPGSHFCPTILWLCETKLSCVMQVAELDGAPRMGPTFGAMFMSGQKAAHCAINSLNRQNALQKQPESADAQKELANA